MSAPVIRVDDLSIGYATRDGTLNAVLRDISLTVEPGEVLGLVGESGCGKSTLAFALLGFLRPGSRVLSGGVQFEGRDLFTLPAAELRRLRGNRIALVPQNAGLALTPTMRVGGQIAETIAAHHAMSGAAARQRAVELLARVGLPDPPALAGRYPHQLSGGQQQRVAIAMALASEPALIVLDEPTTGLDVTTQDRILSLLEDIRARRGVAMVYVSHDLGVIARVSDRLAVMYAGEIVELGEARQLFATPAHPYTRGLLASVPRLSRPGLPQPLPGQPPAPGQRPPGCAFAPRCPFADDRCQEPPAPRPVSSTAGALARQVRCHHWERVVRARRDRPAGSPAPALANGGEPASAERQPLLRVDGLAVSYERAGLGAYLRRLRSGAEPRPALVDVTLSLRPGETLALVGESGSGKSTLARAIAGLQRPRAGDLRYGDYDLRPPVERRPPALRRAIQLVFQNPDASLNPRHTVAEALERPLRRFFRLSARQRRERAAALLDQVRLGPHYLTRYPGQLSGGEKQRVAIARAFAAEPELVICDEVVSALDVSVQAAVLDLLAALRAERGVTYLFISHDLAVVRAIADRVAILYQGALCAVGPTEEVYSPPYHPYTETLLAAVLEPAPGSHRRAVRARFDPLERPAQDRSGRGCPFEARCPRKLGAICEQETPPWRVTPGGHALRCHIPLEDLGRLQSQDSGATIELVPINGRIAKRQ